MNETKKWFQSKTVITGVVTGLLGIYNATAHGLGLPVIPEYIYTVLAALGIYSRVVAKAAIE